MIGVGTPVLVAGLLFLAIVCLVGAAVVHRMLNGLPQGSCAVCGESTLLHYDLEDGDPFLMVWACTRHCDEVERFAEQVASLGDSSQLSEEGRLADE